MLPRIASTIALLIVLAAGVGPALAQTCSEDDFAATVDGAGAQLRAFNAQAAPKFQARVKGLAARKGWGDQDYEDAAITYLQDARIARLDETANTLLARIDTLGRLEPGQKPDCSRLDELKATGIELLAVMKAKSSYLIDKIDAEAAAKPVAAAPPVATSVAGPPAQGPAIKDTLSAPSAATVPSAKKPAASPPWSATTSAAPAGVAMVTPPAQPSSVPPPARAPDTPGAARAADPGVPRPSAALTPAPVVRLEPDEGYTIDEIRDATQGFFGFVSTGLAAVIEHAFANSGRPTGYVLGQEGGGAFLGGLRYGEGTLYVRSGGTQKIFWHGPSIGFDFGAAGARTMFLIYKMREPGDLYRVFSGIDGSAFVVGGVGLTLLGGGDMILAPIRSGIGVRVGANIGYIRFSSTRTWNPF